MLGSKRYNRYLRDPAPSNQWEETMETEIPQLKWLKGKSVWRVFTHMVAQSVQKNKSVAVGMFDQKNTREQNSFWKDE